MTKLRTLLALLLLAGLGGCLYDEPLTSHPSTNIDTRFLGVFEFTERVRKRDGEGGEEEKEEKIQRVAILPHSESRYIIYYRDYSKKPVETLTFIGWISRVDQGYYLSFRDETPGSATFGRYGFVGFDWKWPGNFMIFAPDVEGFAGVKSPYAMRQIFRKKRKDGTLFPYQGTYWTRIARIWWDRKNPEPLATVPKEFETGRDSEKPLL